MAESIKQTVKWKKHEVEEKIGYDQCKFYIIYIHSFILIYDS